MQMNGEQQVAAQRSRVWAALNDPAVLARCIPGCESLTREGESAFLAVAQVKIGPIGARFKGRVELSEIDAPNGYVISGKGNGGVAGHAMGSAKVRLSDAPGGGTLVSYAVEAEVGGRMAQLGGPIIDATAKAMAAKFFATFGAVVGSDAAAPAAGEPLPPPAPAPAAQGAAPAGRTALWGWIAALLAALLTGYVLGVKLASGGIVALVMALLVLVGGAAFEAGRRGGGQ